MRKVTVVIRNKKTNSKIENLIESIEQQTYPNLEILLINEDKQRKE